MELKITAELDGKTVKQILHTHLALSRACVSRLKRLEDGILLENERVTVRAQVSQGQILTLALEDREEEERRFGYNMQVIHFSICPQMGNEILNLSKILSM